MNLNTRFYRKGLSADLCLNDKREVRSKELVRIPGLAADTRAGP